MATGICKLKKSVWSVAVLIFTVYCLCHFSFSLYEKWGSVCCAFSSFACNIFPLIVVFLLMFANILLEALRWRTLHGPFARRSLFFDIETTLLAMAYGNSTPGNVGEHAARAVGYDDKAVAVSASLLASIIQTCVISFVGIVSGAIIFFTERELPVLPSVVALVACFVTVIFILLCVVRYRKSLSDSGVGGSNKVVFFVDDIIFNAGRYANRRVIFRATVINVVRFFVFSFQLFVLLFAYSPCADYNLFLCYLLVLFYYFVVTFVPRINIIDIGVKGNLAVLIFGGLLPYGNISAAVLTIWVINILIPSFCGLIILLFRRKGAL